MRELVRISDPNLDPMILTCALGFTPPSPILILTCTTRIHPSFPYSASHHLYPICLPSPRQYTVPPQTDSIHPSPTQLFSQRRCTAPNFAGCLTEPCKQPPLVPELPGFQSKIEAFSSVLLQRPRMALKGRDHLHGMVRHPEKRRALQSQVVTDYGSKPSAPSAFAVTSPKLPPVVHCICCSIVTTAKLCSTVIKGNLVLVRIGLSIK